MPYPIYLGSNAVNAVPIITVTAPIVRQNSAPLNFLLPGDATFDELVDRVNGLIGADRDSQPASFYTNASNLSTGTVPLGRLSSANSSANGVVSTTTQTFAGDKTFQNVVSMQSTLSVTGEVTLRANTTRLADTTTPWISTVRTLQIGPRLALYDTGSTATFLYNGYINTAGTLVYTQTAPATLYDTAAGLHRWYTAPSGTANTPITFTEVMSLVANGNLGLGNTAPAHKLRIEGAISSSQEIRVATTGTVTSGFVDFFNGGGWDTVGYRGSANLVIGGYRSSQWTAVELFTAGASRLVVDGSGNVGIGTTSLLGRLTVAGGYAYVTDDGTRRLIMGPDGTGTLVGTTTNHYLRFITNDTERVMIAANGNVGFGTASPANRVHIRGTGAGIGAGNEILRIDTSNGDERLQFGVDDTNDFGWIRAVKAGSELPLWLGATGGAIVAGAAAAQTSFAITTGVWGSGTTGNRGVFASGMVLGATGGDYGVVGYNARFNSSGTFTYAVADTSSLIYFGNGFAFRYAGTGTAGNTITHTTIAKMDSVGNFVVGGDTTYSGTGVTSIKIQAVSYPSLALYQNTTNMGLLWSSTDVMLSAVGSRGIQFQTNDVTRMTVTAGGNVLVGSTSDPGYRLSANGQYAFLALNTGTATGSYSAISHTANTGDNVLLYFATDWSSTPTTRGSITYNRAGGVLAYNTTSDYRAKEVYGPIENTGTIVDALRVYRGKMHGATLERPVMIAHEVREIAPYAVTGEKDAMQPDGTPQYQQLDVSTLVPLLVAEIQTLRARVAALEG